MLDQIVLISAVTMVGVLEQAYFVLQVIYARRKHSVSPPCSAGPPEFQRIFRAQANCSENFPLFIIPLWVSGVYFNQAASAFLGLLYLYGRYQYFQGYAVSAMGRLEPLYFSAGVQVALITGSVLGVLNVMCQLYIGFDVSHWLCSVLGLA